jgi:hypothetical protein
MPCKEAEMEGEIIQKQAPALAGSTLKKDVSILSLDN